MNIHDHEKYEYMNESLDDYSLWFKILRGRSNKNDLFIISYGWQKYPSTPAIVGELKMGIALGLDNYCGYWNVLLTKYVLIWLWIRALDEWLDDILFHGTNGLYSINCIHR